MNLEARPEAIALDVSRAAVLVVGDEAVAPDGSASRTLVRDTWNTDRLPALAPQPKDVVVYKPRFSAFFETDLDERLEALGGTQLVVTGCTTRICVDSTVRDAMYVYGRVGARPCGGPGAEAGADLEAR